MAKKTSSAPKAKKTSSAPKVKKTAPVPKAKKIKDEDEENEDDEDDEGPEFIEEDLDEMEDDMLTDDSDVKPRSGDEVLNMLREVECDFCDGSSSRDRCKVRDQYGCPPDKADL